MSSWLNKKGNDIREDDRGQQYGGRESDAGECSKCGSCSSYEKDGKLFCRSCGEYLGAVASLKKSAVSTDDLQEGDRVPLTDGNYGLYEVGAKWEDADAIWDLDSGQYVPIELIDWDRIAEDPSLIMREGKCKGPHKRKKASFFEYDWDKGSPWDVKADEAGEEHIMRKSTEDVEKDHQIKKSQEEYDDKIAAYRRGEPVIMLTGLMSPIQGIVFERVRNADYTYRYTVKSNFDGKFYTVDENELAKPNEGQLFA